MSIRPLLALSVMCLFAGCGSAATQRSTPAGGEAARSAAADPQPPAPERDRSSSVWMLLRGEDSGSSWSARELYAVFGRPQTARDKEADRRVDELGHLLDYDEGATGLGQIEEGAGRLLLDDSRAGIQLYAVPTKADGVTTADGICYVGLPAGGSGCTKPGSDGLVVAAEREDDGPWLLYGLVADPVRGVDVVAAGTAHAAIMGENSFAARLAAGQEPERIVLHRRDGTSSGLNLGSAGSLSAKAPAPR